jgi:outer membrane cobalamin receptor
MGRLALAPLLAVVVTACALHPRPRSSEDRAGPNSVEISAAQIERSGASTVLNALQVHVKNTVFAEDGYGTPQRVRRRGSSTVHLFEDMPIYIDHVQLADVRLLRDMPAREVERIRVLTGFDATTYYGTGAGDGVILIFTRGGS